MTTEHLKKAPINLHKHLWVYEDNGGLSIVAEIIGGKTIVEVFNISRIRAYLRRKDKPNH